ncbi:MAG: hypothetical protein OXM55_00530 [Bdellovibrionales bacterium]|nr:hypothetical protein [Bdellovibrionales bacterium]
MLDKNDKKFISALACAQTGLLLMGIALSGYFWHHSLANLLGMQHLYEVSQTVNEKKDKIEATIKLKKMEEQYENQGIGVSSDTQD